MNYSRCHLSPSKYIFILTCCQSAQIESLTRELEEAKNLKVAAENKNKELSDNIFDLSNQLGVLKKLKEEVG